MNKLKNKFKKKSEDEEEYDEEYDEEYEDDEIIDDILDEDEQGGDVHPSDDVTGDVDISELDEATSDATLSDLPSHGLDLNEETLDSATATDLDVDLSADSTDTLEADLLGGEGDVSLEELDSVEGDLEAGLDELTTDDLEEDIEATGDVDVGQLERDIDIEVEEDEQDWDEDEDEDEEAGSPVQKIINKIKGAFGDLKKKKSSDEDDEEEAPTRTEVDPDAISSASLTSKDKLIATIGEKVPALKGILSKMGGNKVSDDDDDDDESSYEPIDEDEDEKPKKKLKIIHIVILLAAGALFWEDIFPPEVPPPAAKINKIKKRVIKKGPKKDTAVAVKPVEPIKPVEPVADAPKDEITSDTDIPVAMDPVKEEPKLDPEPAIVDKPDVAADEDLGDLFDEEDSSDKLDTPDVVSDTSTADVIDKTTTDNVNDVDAFEENDEDTVVSAGAGQNEPGLELTDGQIDDQVIDGSINQDITKSILQDLEVKITADKKAEKVQGDLKPADPPTFEINGRALVYNCSGKHWACIDSVSFKTCEKNYAWNSSQGRKVECYPVNLYPSTENCEQRQQKNIDNIEDTEFCRF